MNISFTPSISLTHKSQNDHQERQWNKHHFPNEHLFDSNGGYSIDSITPCQHVNVEGLHFRIQKLVICHYSSRKNNQLTMRSQVFSPSPKYPKTLPPQNLFVILRSQDTTPFWSKTGSTIHPSSWVPGSNDALIHSPADRVRICSIFAATSMPFCETMSFGQPGWSFGLWRCCHIIPEGMVFFGMPEVWTVFLGFFVFAPRISEIGSSLKRKSQWIFGSFVMNLRVGVFGGPKNFFRQFWGGILDNFLGVVSCLVLCFFPPPKVFFLFQKKASNSSMRFVTQLDHTKWRSQTFTPEKVRNKTPKKENWEINPAASYIRDYMDRQYMDPYENQGWFGGWNPTQLYRL